MPDTILAQNIVATKLADGAVQLLFTGPNGDVRFASVIASADFTSLNTTVNGGSTGATVTLVYAENARKTDYPVAAERT